MGIMKGVSEQSFGSTEHITLSMAAAALVRALGYGELAEYKSGYSIGYITMADEVGLLKGVSKDENLTQSEVIRLLYNFMNNEIYNVIGISNKDYIKDTKDGDTVLKVYHGIIGIKDIVTANSITALSSPNGTGDNNSVVIGNKVLHTDSNLNSYLGYETEAYYDFESEKIIFSLPTSKNSTVLVNSSEFIRYASGKVEYERDDKIYTLSLPVSADIIYNGKAESFKESLFSNLKLGNILFLDNNNDNKYEVILITEYVNHIAGDKSQDSEIIKYKYENGALNLKTYTDYEIRNASGEAIDINAVPSDTVISVAESKDKTYAVIYTGKGSITGKTEEILNDGNFTYFSIDGKLYEADPNFILKNAFVGIGSAGEFYIDAFGKIAYFSEIITKNEGYAILLNVKEHTTYEKFVYLKMYSEHKQMLNVEAAEKITIDGLTQQNPDKLMDYAVLYDIKKDDGGNIISKDIKIQLIRYKLNSKGQVMEIDTTVYNEGYEDPYNTAVYSDAGTFEYSGTNRALGSTLYLTGDCKVFTVTDLSDITVLDYEDLDVTQPKAMFENESDYNVTGFKSSYETLMTSYLITDKQSSSLNTYSQPYVVKKITDFYDEKDETAVKKITLLFKGAEESYLVRDDELISNIGIGDVVVISVNSDGELTNLRHCYDADAEKGTNTKTALSYPNGSGTTDDGEKSRGANWRAVYRAVYSMDDDVFTITKDPTASAVETELHRIPAYIYIVDTKKNTVTNGSIVDITDYKTDKDDYTWAVFYETKKIDYGLIIYK